MRIPLDRDVAEHDGGTGQGGKVKGTVTDMSFPCLSRALRNGRPSRLVTCCLPHDTGGKVFLPWVSCEQKALLRSHVLSHHTLR